MLTLSASLLANIASRSPSQISLTLAANDKRPFHGFGLKRTGNRIHANAPAIPGAAVWRSLSPTSATLCK